MRGEIERSLSGKVSSRILFPSTIWRRIGEGMASLNIDTISEGIPRGVLFYSNNFWLKSVIFYFNAEFL
jgi:hypothetical protein